MYEIALKVAYEIGGIAALATIALTTNTCALLNLILFGHLPSRRIKK